MVRKNNIYTFSEGSNMNIFDFQSFFEEIYAIFNVHLLSILQYIIIRPIIQDIVYYYENT